MENETIALIDAYVREKCEIAEDEDYDIDTDLFNTGYLDSIGATELMTYVEQQLGITFSQKDIVLYPMNTVREIAAVADIKRKEN